MNQVQERKSNGGHQTDADRRPAPLQRTREPRERTPTGTAPKRSLAFVVSMGDRRIVKPEVGFEFLAGVIYFLQHTRANGASDPQARTRQLKANSGRTGQGPPRPRNQLHCQ